MSRTSRISFRNSPRSTYASFRPLGALLATCGLLGASRPYYPNTSAVPRIEAAVPNFDSLQYRVCHGVKTASGCEERDHTVSQLALAWTLASPAVDVAIVGARRPDHIEGTAPAAEFDLPEDDLREIENIMQGVVMVGSPSPEGV